MLAAPIRVALRVGQALDALGVPWIVAGSVASSVHGIPRATQDVDLVAELRRIHAGPLLRDLGREVSNGDVLVTVDRFQRPVVVGPWRVRFRVGRASG